MVQSWHASGGIGTIEHEVDKTMGELDSVLKNGDKNNEGALA
jgi:hypothetical protein